MASSAAATPIQARLAPYDHHSSSSSSASISELWNASHPPSDAKVGLTRTLFPSGQPITVLSSLGKDYAQNESGGPKQRELLRKAVGSGVKSLKTLDLKPLHVAVDVEAGQAAYDAAVAAHLAAYQFTLKTSPPSKFNPSQKESIPEPFQFKPSQESKEWNEGAITAESQNFARTLMELPANMMTPTAFCERIKAEFAGLDNVEIHVRDEAWAEEQGMNSFLSVTHGTSEPAKLLEVHYKGASSSSSQPLALVGKGITFDSGGISLKGGAGMKLMRGDMGGAATVMASMLAIAKLKLPVNVIAVTPLTENMPGPSATKPGDIIYAMNGKSIEVDNTDAEGRLVLADAMYYASKTFEPHTLIDVATLTGAMVVALGEVYTGVFTNSDELWNGLSQAGEKEYDRFWRMPLEEDYGPQIYSSNADLCNTGGSPAGSCTAALFLKHFVHGESTKWAHVDIAGTMEATRPTPYMEKGMTGRPVRGLVEYVRSLSV